jgi:hypothetical protein
MVRNFEMIQRITDTPVSYPITFALIGDTGAKPNPVGDLIFRELLAQIGDQQFAVTLGDFAGPGTLDRHDHYLSMARKLDIPNICVLGNHDRDDPVGVANFEQIHGPLNYQFALGNTRFVAINCQCHTDGPRDEDLEYLDRCLGVNELPVSVVFMHMPPHFSGRFHPHEEWGFTHHESDFLEIITRNRVSLVCCAHVLCYDFHVYEGIPFVTTGGGGWGICTHLGAGCTVSRAPGRGVFYHYATVSIEANGRLSGGVVRACEGNVPDPAFNWSM